MPKNILILSLAALLACAHEEVAQNPAERDWEKGLDAARGPQIAPVGPIDTDQGAYNYIRRREQEHDLGSRMTAAGLDEIIGASSQVLASALALPLFRAGVYLVVWVLHASDAPPVTFLAGETAPNTADAINDGFLRGVQAVRPIAHNP